MSEIKNQYLADAIDLARLAGKLLVDFRDGDKKLEVIDKKEMGIATNADLAAEKLILSEIGSRYPSHGILSEEFAFNSSFDKKWPLTEYLWIIDPLDGTNNYFNGLAFYSVSIALAGPEGVVAGVVYNPEIDRMYAASKEDGAFLEYRGKKTFLNKKENDKNFSECLLSPFMGASKGLLTKEDYLHLLKVKNQCRAFRRMGSAALEISMVASGELDGYWEKGLSPWDMAAAAFICEKAGIKVTEISGAEFTPFSSTILSAPSKHHDKITQLLGGQS